MKNLIRFRAAIAAAVAILPLLTAGASAQSYDEQARNILKLYDAGQKDSAYVLIEPLKRRARFAPAILYTRARLTQDDRALPLFKEAIALDPSGAWADSSTFQLVRRYAEKRDSAAAYTWLTVLHNGYPKSNHVQSAEDLLASVKTWDVVDDDVAEKATAKLGEGAKAGQRTAKAAAPSHPALGAEKAAPKSLTSGPRAEGTGPKAISSEPRSTEKPAPKEVAKPVAAKTAVAAKTTAKTEDAKPAAKTEKSTKAASEKSSKATTQPVETYRSTGMSGYALQVGIFSTKKAALDQGKILRKKNIRTTALPKDVKGKKQYALIVGPYEHQEDAVKKKSAIASACNCQAYLVKVE
jgi:hypothetical protein